MARRCQLSGVQSISGHSISHAHNKSKRRFLPNLQKKRIWVQELNKFVTVRVTARSLKTLAKNGTAALARLIRDKQISVH